MKQLLRLVVALGMLAVPAAAHAQISGGFRISDLAFDPVGVRLVVAAFGTVPLNDIVAFQPEMLLRMQGTTLSDGSTTFKTRSKFEYLQVPLLGRLRVGKGSPLVVFAGPSLALKVPASFEGDVVYELDDFVKGFDTGLVAGAAIDADHLVLDGRYTWGLPNLAKDPSGSSNPGGLAKHRVFSFGMGFRF